MKRRDYEMSIEIEVSNAGTVSEFCRGMEVGAITMLKHIISIDRDLDEEDRLYLLEKAEKQEWTLWRFLGESRLIVGGKV